MTIRSIVQFIRLPNLVVIAFTQVLLGILLYQLIPFHTLQPWSFLVLILTTIFIAAAGNIINDIYDSEIDLINKPDKVIVGQRISVKSAWSVYWFVIFVGFILAIYLAWNIQDFKQLFIYPFATLLLWAYAKYLKKSFIIGNIIVALYCAFVPGIILYAERIGFYSLSEKSPHNASFIMYVFIIYAIMAFLTTVWREITKDMEDIKGDRAHGASTLPVQHGMLFAQKIITAIGGLVFILIFYYIVYLSKAAKWSDFLYLSVVLALTGNIVYQNYHSLAKKTLHQSSQRIKLVMVLGLGYLFFLI